MTPVPRSAQAPIERALLRVEHLSIGFHTDKGELCAVDDMSYEIFPGKTLGWVGESGCGKSTTALSLLGLLPSNATLSGHAHFAKQDLLALTEGQWRAVRGNRIAMIFQEPMTALNPVTAIGQQIGETLVLHQGLGRRAAQERAIEMLDEVGIPSARARAAAYPHQLSGGMRQRAMIAMALACRPSLLIADEPTTALDVTIQAQMLELMLELQDRIGMAIQFISHNLGVVSELADDIIVMYAGRIVERAPAARLFDQPVYLQQRRNRTHASSLKQATSCPGATVVSEGTCSRHWAATRAQRSAKRQPGTATARSGRPPGITGRRGWRRCKSGMVWISPTV